MGQRGILSDGVCRLRRRLLDAIIVDGSIVGRGHGRLEEDSMANTESMLIQFARTSPGVVRDRMSNQRLI